MRSREEILQRINEGVKAASVRVSQKNAELINEGLIDPIKIKKNTFQSASSPEVAQQLLNPTPVQYQETANPVVDETLGDKYTDVVPMVGAGAGRFVSLVGTGMAALNEAGSYALNAVSGKPYSVDEALQNFADKTKLLGGPGRQLSNASQEQYSKETRQALAELGAIGNNSNLTETQGALETAKWAAKNPGTVAVLLGENLIGSGLGTSAVGTVLPKAMGLGARVSVGTGIQEGAGYLDERANKTGTLNTDDVKMATAVGIVNGALEKYLGGTGKNFDMESNLLGLNNISREAIKDLPAAMGREAVTEAGQEWVSNASGNVQDGNEITQGGGSASTLGAILGAGTTAVYATPHLAIEASKVTGQGTAASKNLATKAYDSVKKRYQDATDLYNYEVHSDPSSENYQPVRAFNESMGTIINATTAEEADLAAKQGQEVIVKATKHLNDLRDAYKAATTDEEKAAAKSAVEDFVKTHYNPLQQARQAMEGTGQAKATNANANKATGTDYVAQKIDQYVQANANTTATNTITPTTSTSTVQPTVNNKDSSSSINTSNNVTNTTNTTTTTKGNGKSLVQSIISRESGGNYGIANLSGSHQVAKGVDVTKMSIGQILGSNLNATGKYQTIKGTLKLATDSLGISRNTLYTPDVQERVGRWLMFEKQPALGAYIRGEHNDINKALHAASNEWQAVGSPLNGDRITIGRGKNVKRALTSYKEVAPSLQAARQAYAEAIKQGKSKAEAETYAINFGTTGDITVEANIGTDNSATQTTNTTNTANDTLTQARNAVAQAISQRKSLAEIQELQKQVEELKAQAVAKGETVEPTEEQKAQSKVVVVEAAQQVRANTLDATHIDQLEHAGVLTEEDANELRRMLDIKRVISSQRSPEQVDDAVYKGTKGATTAESDIGLSEYQTVLDDAIEKNDTATLDNYLSKLDNFAQNQTSKAAALEEAIAMNPSNAKPLYIAPDENNNWKVYEGRTSRDKSDPTFQAGAYQVWTVGDKAVETNNRIIQNATDVASLNDAYQSIVTNRQANGLLDNLSPKTPSSRLPKSKFANQTTSTVTSTTTTPKKAFTNWNSKDFADNGITFTHTDPNQKTDDDFHQMVKLAVNQGSKAGFSDNAIINQVSKVADAFGFKLEDKSIKNLTSLIGTVKSEAQASTTPKGSTPTGNTSTVTTPAAKTFNNSDGNVRTVSYNEAGNVKGKLAEDEVWVGHDFTKNANGKTQLNFEADGKYKRGLSGFTYNNTDLEGKPDSRSLAMEMFGEHGMFGNPYRTNAKGKFAAKNHQEALNKYVNLVKDLTTSSHGSRLQFLESFEQLRGKKLVTDADSKQEAKFLDYILNAPEAQPLWDAMKDSNNTMKVADRKAKVDALQEWIASVEVEYSAPNDKGKVEITGFKQSDTTKAQFREQRKAERKGKSEVKTPTTVEATTPSSNVDVTPENQAVIDKAPEAAKAELTKLAQAGHTISESKLTFVADSGEIKDSEGYTLTRKKAFSKSTGELKTDKIEAQLPIAKNDLGIKNLVVVQNMKSGKFNGLSAQMEDGTTDTLDDLLLGNEEKSLSDLSIALSKELGVPVGFNISEDAKKTPKSEATPSTPSKQETPATATVSPPSSIQAKGKVKSKDKAPDKMLSETELKSGITLEADETIDTLFEYLNEEMDLSKPNDLAKVLDKITLDGTVVISDDNTTEYEYLRNLILAMANYMDKPKLVINPKATKASYNPETNTIEVAISDSMFGDIAAIVLKQATLDIADDIDNYTENLASEVSVDNAEYPTIMTDSDVKSIEEIKAIHSKLTKAKKALNRDLLSKNLDDLNLDSETRRAIYVLANSSLGDFLSVSLSNKKVREYLKTVTYKDKQSKSKSSLYTYISRAFREFFGFTNKEANVLDTLLSITGDIATIKLNQSDFAESMDARQAVLKATEKQINQELKKPYKTRNRFVVSFTQAKDKPLASVKDLMTKIAQDPVKAAQYLLGEQLSPEQEREIKYFADFSNKFTIYLKSAYAENPQMNKDLKSYLFDPNTGNLDTNLAGALTLAVYDYIKSNGNKNKNTYDDVKKILNLDKDSNAIIPGHIYRQYAYKGNLASFVAADLGKVAVAALGINETENAAKDSKSELEMSLGNWALHAMQIAELGSLQFMPQEQHLNNIKTVRGTEPGGLSENGSDYVFFTFKAAEAEPKSTRVEEIIKVSKNTKGIVAKLFNIESGVRYPKLTAPSKVKRKIKKSRSLVSNLQATFMEAMQREPIEADVVTYDVMDTLLNNHNSWFKHLVGAAVTKDELNKMHINDRESAEAAAEGLEREIDNGMSFIGSLKRNKKGFQNFWDSVYTASNNRMHFNSNVFNMQTSIIQRMMASYKNFRTTINMEGINLDNLLEHALDDKGNPTKIGLFLSAVAMNMEDFDSALAADIKDTVGTELKSYTKDKVYSKDFMPAFVKLLQTDKVQSAISAMQKAMNKQKLSKAELNAIEDFVDTAGMKMQSVRALIELTNMVKAMESGSELSTGIGLGSDGINNGIALASIYNGVATERTLLQTGFIPKNDRNIKTQFDTKLHKDIGDYYEAFAEVFTRNMQDVKESADSFPSVVKAIEVIEAIQPAFDIIANPKAARKLAKAIIIPFGYSAGTDRLVQVAQESFISDIQKKMAKLANDKAINNTSPDYVEFQEQLQVLLDDKKFTLPEEPSALLEFWFTPKQLGALSNTYGTIVEKALKNSLEEFAGAFKSSRERNIAMHEATFEMFNEIRESIIANATVKLADKLEITLDEMNERGFTNKEWDTLVEPQIARITPRILNAFATTQGDIENSENIDLIEDSLSSLEVLSRGKKFIGGKVLSKVKGKNVDDLLQMQENTLPAMTRIIKKVGVLINSAQVQGTDGRISAEASAMLGGKVNLNNHDQNDGGLGNYLNMVLTQNKAAFKTLAGNHLQLNSLEAFVETLQTATAMYSEGAISELVYRNVLNKAFFGISRSINPEHTSKTKVWDIDKTEIMDLLTELVHETEKGKIDILTNLQAVQQYAGEMGEYIITDEDIQLTIKELGKITSRMDALVKSIESNDLLMKELAIPAAKPVNAPKTVPAPKNAKLKSKEDFNYKAINEITLHSGGAKGSDTLWGSIGKSFGLKNIKHYQMLGNKTPNGNVDLKLEDLDSNVDDILKRTAKRIGRTFPTKNEYVNNLMRRNNAQVVNADTIFAIGVIENNQVLGGTGWAVDMAINEYHKPVNVFDQNKNQWFKWNYDTNSFERIDTPILTKNFAGIGTREINNNGKQAIKEVYQKTQNSLKPKDNISTAPVTLPIDDSMVGVKSNKNGLVTQVPKALLGKGAFLINNYIEDIKKISTGLLKPHEDRYTLALLDTILNIKSDYQITLQLLTDPKAIKAIEDASGKGLYVADQKGGSFDVDYNPESAVRLNLHHHLQEDLRKIATHEFVHVATVDALQRVYTNPELEKRVNDLYATLNKWFAENIGKLDEYSVGSIVYALTNQNELLAVSTTQEEVIKHLINIPVGESNLFQEMTKLLVDLMKLNYGNKSITKQVESAIYDNAKQYESDLRRTQSDSQKLSTVNNGTASKGSDNQGQTGTSSVPKQDTGNGQETTTLGPVENPIQWIKDTVNDLHSRLKTKNNLSKRAVESARYLVDTLLANNPDINIEVVNRAAMDLRTARNPEAHGAKGLYDVNTNTIYILDSTLEAQGDAAYDSIINLLHEVVHANTERNINSGDKAYAKSIDALEQLLEQLRKVGSTDPVIQTALSNISELAAYGMTHEVVKEFIGKYGRNTRAESKTEAVKSFLGKLASLLGLKSNKYHQFVIHVDNLSQYNPNPTPTPPTGGKTTLPKANLHSASHLTGLSAGNSSSTHDAHLDSIIDMIDTFVGNDANRGRTIQDSTKAKTPMSIVTRLGMSDKEASVYEATRAVLSTYIKTQGNNVGVRELQNMAREFNAGQLTKEDFVDDWATATKDERNHATALFNNILGANPSNMKSDVLIKFTALALSSEKFRQILDKPRQRISKYENDDSLFSDAMTMLENGINKMTELYVHTNNKNITGQIDRLFYNLQAIDEKARINKETLDQKVWKGIGVIGNVVNGSTKTVLAKAINLAKGSSNERMRKFGEATNELAKNDATAVGTLILDTVSKYSKLAGKRYGEGRNLVNEIVSTTHVKKVHERIARFTTSLGQLRQQIQDNTREALLDEFTNRGKDLSRAARDSITTVALRSDMASLLEYMGITEVMALLRSPSNREQRIKDLEQQIKAMEDGNDMVMQAKALAAYMIANKGTKHLVKSTQLIAIRHGLPSQVELSQMDKATYEAVNTLTSLYATRYGYSKSGYHFDQVIAQEEDGIKAMLKAHKAMIDRSRADFLSNPYNYSKGYLPNISDPHRSLVWVEPNEVAKYLTQGWQNVTDAPLKRDVLDTTFDRVLLYHPHMDYQNRVSGGLDLIDTHAKGQIIYAESQDLARVAKARAQERIVRSKTVRAEDYNPFDEDTAMIATYGADGAIQDYHYEMESFLRDDYLQRNNDPFALLSRMDAKTQFKPQIEESQRSVAHALYEDYKANYAKNPELFVVLDPDSDDKKIRDDYALTPYAFKVEAHKLFGDGPIVVRASVYNTVFGYKVYSLGNIFNKEYKNMNKFEKLFYVIFSILLGKKAKSRVIATEDVVKMLTKQVKDFIVIRGTKVLIGNILANTMLLMLQGVNPVDIMKGYNYAWQEGQRYRRSQKIVMQLRTKMMYAKANEMPTLRRQIMAEEHSMKRSSMHDYMQQGIMSTIVEDVTVLKDQLAYKTGIEQKLDELGDKTPAPIKTAFDWMVVNPGTPMHKFLSDATQFSDFSAKYVLAEHLRKKGMSSDEALSLAQESFINFDLPQGQGMDYMGRMGLFMFTKFFFRFQRVLSKLLWEKPAQTIAQHYISESLFNMQGVLDPLMTNNLGNPFDFGALNLLDGQDTVMTEMAGLVF